MPSPEPLPNRHVPPPPAGLRLAAFSYYRRLARVRSFVHERHAEPLSLADAARIAGLEETYFSKFFHDKTGVCFRDWLRWVRIEHACRLLHRRNDSITSVAFEVGFQDLRTFERAFKQTLGETPQDFKTRVRPA